MKQSVRPWPQSASGWLALFATLVWMLAPTEVAGQEAPAFTAIGFENRAPMALVDLRGQVVLLNTWATWCSPCREEMPLLQSFADDFGSDGLRVIGVSIDRDGSDERIRDFMAETVITFEIWHDAANTFARAFRTSGVPETFLIGRDGQVLHQWKGR